MQLNLPILVCFKLFINIHYEFANLIILLYIGQPSENGLDEKLLYNMNKCCEDYVFSSLQIVLWLVQTQD